MHHVTLKDVARDVGLSVSCVARALKGRPDIPESTCKRVRESAQRLGYQPDPMLTALSAYRQSNKASQFRGILAFISTHKTEQEYLANPESGDLLRGARERAASLGYELEYFNIGTARKTHLQAAKILLARGIQGLLIRSYPLVMDDLHLPLEKFHCVDLFSEPYRPGVCTVSSNHVQSMELALQKVLETGAQHPGLVLREALSNTLHHGWLMAFKVFTTRFPKASILLYDDASFTFDDLPPWTRENKIDTLFYCMTENAIAAHQKNRRPVAKHIRRVCMDLINPDCGMAGIHQNRAGAGATAVDWLQSFLITSKLGMSHQPNSLMITGLWRDGKPV